MNGHYVLKTIIGVSLALGTIYAGWLGASIVDIYETKMGMAQATATHKEIRADQRRLQNTQDAMQKTQQQITAAIQALAIKSCFDAHPEAAADCTGLYPPPVLHPRTNN